ncbi:MAG: hypothetical protein AB4062_07365 [Crocosphaera sp.]
MIKLSIKIITLASLTVPLGLYFIPKNSFSLPSHEVKLTKAQNNTVPVALPYDATVTLNSNDEMSGQMISFEPQQSEITLQRSGRSKKIAITNIKKIEFGQKFQLLHTGELVIRGEDDDFDPNTVQTWQIALTQFKIIDAQDGKAEIILSGISKRKLDGIMSVSQSNTYVIDQLIFNNENNSLIITAIPY